MFPIKESSKLKDSAMVGIEVASKQRLTAPKNTRYEAVVELWGPRSDRAERHPAESSNL